MYAHPASGDRYAYNFDAAKDSPGKSWNAGKVAFHAYRPPASDESPRPGTVGIYQLSASGPDRFQLTEHPELFAGSGWNQSSAPIMYALPTGYRVGEKVREIEGLNQHNEKTKLSNIQDGQSWIWLDICAIWCGPCNWMSSKARAFVDAMNGQGVPLREFPILPEGFSGASTTQNASNWAVKYKLPFVIHSDGDENSPLRDLVYRFAFTNGESEAGYPTSVLIDPHGVISVVQLGMDLDLWQEKIGAAAGKSLVGGPWNT